MLLLLPCRATHSQVMAGLLPEDLQELHDEIKGYQVTRCLRCYSVVILLLHMTVFISLFCLPAARSCHMFDTDSEST